MATVSSREASSVSQFDRWSHSYESGIWSRYFSQSYDAVIESSKKSIKKSTFNVVDVGCGTGLFLQRFSNKIPGVNALTGIDLSKEMIKIARNKKYTAKKIVFSVESSSSMSLETSEYDVVFCLNALHHFPDHREVFKEFSRILRAGGTLILLELFTDGLARKSWLPIMKKIFNERDVEFHNRKELIALGKSANFSLIDGKNYGYFSALNIYEAAK